MFARDAFIRQLVGASRRADSWRDWVAFAPYVGGA
jgi:hypothetical protein